ncbi:rap guanine nucleotide exchange factor 1-like [Sinocyclocheilus grahami]|nr:PREDICTED: rap guanine nucleotide exchange factor 1-like [Sinocyclocheilus grahami]
MAMGVSFPSHSLPCRSLSGFDKKDLYHMILKFTEHSRKPRALHSFNVCEDKLPLNGFVACAIVSSPEFIPEQHAPRERSRVSSCLSRLYQSLANLIRWSDQVMLEGVNLEDKETVATVTTVIKAVLDGVKELVKVAIEKQEHPSPTTPVKTLLPAASPQREPPVIESKETVLDDTPTPAEATETPNDVPDEEVAPPKPPLPGLKVPEHWSWSKLPLRSRSTPPLQHLSKPCFLLPVHSEPPVIESKETVLDDTPTPAEATETPNDVPDEEVAPPKPPLPGLKVPEHCPQREPPVIESKETVLDDTPTPAEATETPNDVPDEEVAPPKPPLPGLKVPEHCPPALPPKKRQSAPSPTRIAVVAPMSRTTSGSSLPIGICRQLPTVLKYMQFMEDYSEPLPSVFYQTPQSESIYEQRNRKRFQEVYGLSDSFSSSDETLPPPALPPKQRQLASSHSASPSSSSSSSLSGQLQQCASGPGPGETESALSLSASNSCLNHQGSLPVPTSESANDEGGEGEYVNLYSSNQANGDVILSNGDSSCGAEDSLQDSASEHSKDPADREGWKQKCVDSELTSEEVDELYVMDHDEIMSHLTLKQENDDGPDVRAGSGDILLVHATETDRKDRVLYCEAFLTTYRTFLAPEDLIKKLRYRYTRFSLSSDIIKQRASKNTFFVLVRVVDELCLVELTEDILKQLMELVFNLLCNGELTLARVLRKNILDKVQQKKLLQYTNSLKTLAARGVAARPGTLHDFRSHEIADQLTLLDAELFYKIEIPEVLLWAKEQNEEKSPNLTQFTEHFNNMSYWVRSLIIQQEKAQDREKLLLKFIKIMKHLRKLNNFNSYLAILSALDSAPIRRLEWQKQTSEGLEEYCTLIDSSSSFRAYRAALADVEPPCIPYLGLILQDLTFVHLGNPDLINRKINFSKRWQQFNILDTMRRFQQVHYDLKHNDDIVSFFNDFSDHLAEEALWELSLKIKPRNITRRKTEREERT